MPHVCNIITAVVMAVAVCCAVIGTAGSQYRGDFIETTSGAEAKVHVFLYKIRTEINGDSTDDHYDRDDFACGSLYDKLTTAFAFGIIGCVASALAVLFAVVRMCTGKLPRLVPALFCIATCAALVIAFAVSLSTFTQSQCDVPSYDDRDFKVDWGLAILIAGAGVSLVGTCLSLIF